MNRVSDEEIGREFRRGSPEAVQAVRERVRRIIGFRGHRVPADEKKDLEQEVMTQIWQAANRSSFDAGGRFWGFVEVVTARRCIDWLRARIARNRETGLDEGLEDGSRGPLGSTLDIERRELAQKAIARLGGPCRELMTLHFGLEKSYREIATLMGKSEGALRVQMHRCIARTRKVVEQLKTEPSPKTGAEER